MRNIYRPFFRRKKGGVTRIVRDNYGNSAKDWYETVKEILQRDEYKCRNVKSTGRECLNNLHLQVHHIVPLSKGGRTVGSNLITLCEDCHKERHSHMK